MSQAEATLRYLRKNKSITQQDAIDNFKCYRLAPRIAELKAKGYVIVTLREAHPGGSHARYRLIENAMAAA